MSSIMLSPDWLTAREPNGRVVRMLKHIGVASSAARPEASHPQTGREPSGSRPSAPSQAFASNRGPSDILTVSLERL